MIRVVKGDLPHERLMYEKKTTFVFGFVYDDKGTESKGSK